MLLRNRPVPVGVALGVLRAEACLVTVNPLLGRERVRRDLEELGLSIVAGEPDDLADLVTDG
ncbi:MAG: long-chain fatty acid--CoA ligase, partial [Gemmatimonadota bacterium]